MQVKLNSNIRKYITSAQQHAPAFAPGIFLISLGVLACLAPSLVIGIVAGFFIFLGTLVCVMAWRLIQLKRKFDKVAKQFQGRVFVQGLNLEPQVVEDIEVIDHKKIVLH